MSDVFLVLAQTDEGLSCFLLPRILPDGTRNAFHIQRLKDKLGNHSNASWEIELHGAWARMVGEPGRGVPTIIEMVGHTRLDCVIGSAAGMRAGVVNATHHAAHRQAFGKTLIDQPLMRNVLADLCLESEATTALAMRLARAYDEAHADAQAGEDATDAQLFKRLATARGQVLDLQARPQPRLRVARVPGRQRLRRGVGHAPPVPRGAAGLDLGGLGQRHEPRRPARADAYAAIARGLPGRGRGGRAVPSRRLDARVKELKDQFADPADARDPRPARGRRHGPVPAGLAARTPRAAGGGRCLLRLAPRRRRRPGVRHAAGGQRLRGHHRARSS